MKRTTQAHPNVGNLHAKGLCLWRDSGTGEQLYLWSGRYWTMMNGRHTIEEVHPSVGQGPPEHPGMGAANGNVERPMPSWSDLRGCTILELKPGRGLRSAVKLYRWRGRIFKGDPNLPPGKGIVEL